MANYMLSIQTEQKNGNLPQQIVYIQYLLYLMMEYCILVQMMVNCMLLKLILWGWLILLGQGMDMTIEIPETSI